MLRDFLPGRAGTWPGVIAAAILIPLTIAVAVRFPGITLASTLLILLLEVVVVALLSNFPVALLTAVVAVLAANFYLTVPQHTFQVDDPAEVIGLCVFVATAALASFLVTLVLSARESAARSAVEADTYRSVVTTPAASSSPEPALRQIMELLRLDEVELRDRSGRRIAWVTQSTVGPDVGGEGAFLDEELPDRYHLWGSGPVIVAADRHLVLSLGEAAVRSQQTLELVGPQPDRRRAPGSADEDLMDALSDLRPRLERIADSAEELSLLSGRERELARQLAGETRRALELMAEAQAAS